MSRVVKSPATLLSESMIAAEKVKNARISQEQISIKEQERAEELERERISNLGSEINKASDDYYNFRAILKKSLLDEAINKIFIPAIPIEKHILQPETITFTEAFTKKNGVNRVIKNFKRSTPLLSSIALIIENAEKEILKKVEKGDPSTYNVDPEDLARFSTLLDHESIRDMSDIISDRVKDIVDDFIEKNSADKAKHIEILEKSVKKADEARNEDIAEEILSEAKRETANILSNRPFSIFEGMVRKISAESFVNENLSDTMLNENGSLDMDSIMESSIIMYTFLETLNTAKIDQIDNDTLRDIYMSL